MNWYYAIGGRQIGPVSEADLGELVKSGTVTEDTLVWREGMADWLPYARTKSGAAPGPSPAASSADPNAVLCSECGRTFPTDELIRYESFWICAACKPTFFQRLREAGRISTAMLYAGFWIRVGAKILDQILLSVVGYAMGIVIGLLMSGTDPAQLFARQVVASLVGMIIALSYTVWFLGKFGATPGKMACGLKVVTADGDPITYGRACGRYFAEILSGLILGIGYLMVAFDTEKRALHDRICHTRVVRK